MKPHPKPHHSEGASSRAELVNAWVSDHGTEPPKGISTRLLRFSAAYNEQARELGDVRPSDQKRLISTIRHGIEVDREPAIFTATSTKVGPGTRLVRNWKRRTHIVDVCEDHVVYDGRRFRSLTAVARAITGTNWSGPRFFGLTK